MIRSSLLPILTLGLSAIQCCPAAAFFAPPTSRCRGSSHRPSRAISDERFLPVIAPASSPLSTTALSVIRDPRSGPSDTSFNDDDGSSSNGSNDNDPRTDPKSLLTQRSVQTLLHLLKMTNDGTSAKWLEQEFLETSGQLEYHGTGAAYLERFGSTEEIMVRLMESPVVTKRIVMGAKYTGGDSGAKTRARDDYLNSLGGGGGWYDSKDERGGGGSSANSAEKDKGGRTNEEGGSNAASPQPQKSYSPFGNGPASASADASASASADAAAKNTQRPTGGGMGFGSSYLDSIGSGSAAQDDLDDVRTESIGSGKKEDITTTIEAVVDLEEALHRSLLATRLESKLVVFRKKKEKESFHRSLLVARLEMSPKSMMLRQSRRIEGFHRAMLLTRIELEQRAAERARIHQEKVLAQARAKQDAIDRVRLAQDRQRALKRIEASNPYCKSDEDEYYIDLEIDPLSLARRLLAVREQIASELVEDLTLIFQADKHLISSMLFRESTNDLRATTDSEDSDSDNENENEDAAADGSPSDSSIAAGDDDYTPLMPSSSLSSFAPDEGGLFERGAVAMHNDKMAYLATGKAASVFRKGNFDLIYNLCTQASVHRLLSHLMSASKFGTASDRAAARAHNEASFNWLRDFYVDRVADYFDGDVKYGRADAFLEDWLRQPVIGGDGMEGGSVDPMELAEQMLRIRSDIVMEWRKSMRMVPDADHGWLRLLMMEKRMEVNSSSSGEGGGSSGSGIDEDLEEGFQ